MPPTQMFAHHRGGQRQPTPGNKQRPSPSPIIPSPRSHTHTELPPGPGPSSNLNRIPTRQTLPGSQSEHQGPLWTRLRFELRIYLIDFPNDMGRPARLRRKLRRAEHFATLAADVAALAGNAKSGARLAPVQRGRTGASPAAENAAYKARCPRGRRMGAPPTAVKAARGAEHAPAERRAGAPHVAENAERRAGAPHVAENAAATGAVALSQLKPVVASIDSLGVRPGYAACFDSLAMSAGWV